MKDYVNIRKFIEQLFDNETFVDLDADVSPRYFEFNMGSKDLTGDGVIAGYGEVNGRSVFCFGTNPSQLGGSIGEMGATKITKIMDLAFNNGRPIIGLWDSGGARIQEGIRSLEACATIFRRNIRYSGVIPQISVVLGPCAGAASYSPALTDFIIQERSRGLLFITGPTVVRASIGEMSSFEELGGVEVHSKHSGLTHFVADNEDHALNLVRELLSYIPDNHNEQPPGTSPENPTTKSFDIDPGSLLPKANNGTYDMLHVVDCLVDDKLFQVHEQWARNIITGFARFGGQSVGIIANQPLYLAGSIDSAAATKAGRFIRFCDCFNIPLVVFVDVPGFYPGRASEKQGVIRNGAKLLYAFCEATVPRISIVIRKAYGGAHIVMNSKSIQADFNFAWPGSEFAVMGPESAVDILYKKELGASPARRKEFINQYRNRYTNPHEAAKLGYIDKIISPIETRDMIIECLKLLSQKRRDDSKPVHGNIPL